MTVNPEAAKWKMEMTGESLKQGHFGWLKSEFPASIKKSPESLSIALCEYKNVQSVVSSQQKV